MLLNPLKREEYSKIAEVVKKVRAKQVEDFRKQGTPLTTQVALARELKEANPSWTCGLWYIKRVLGEWDRVNAQDVKFSRKPVIRVKTKAGIKTISDSRFLRAISESHSAAQTIRELRQTVEMLSKELSLQETVEELLSDSIKALPVPRKLPVIAQDGLKRPTLSADLMISDLHSGETVNKEAMEGFNEYDFEIMNDRLWTLTQEVVHLTGIFRHGYTINTLYIDLLGDLVTGNIHEELRKTNNHPLIPTTVQTAFILSQLIALLSTHYEHVIVTSVPGNHGRNSLKYEFKNPHDNFDWLITQMIAGFLRNYINQKRVIFNIPAAFSCIVEKEGWRFLLTHGDKFKGGSFGGVPYYTIERFRGKEMIRRHSKGGFDYLQMGDKHIPAGLAMNKILMNGSLIGDSEYSSGNSFESFPPTQKFFLISHKYGATLPVDLQLTETKKSEFVYNYSEMNVGNQLNDAVI